MDLFAPTLPGEEAIQWIEDGYTIYPVCFNVETYRTFTTVTAHNPLPPQLPPGNAWELPVPVPSPPGVCKNVSDALTPDADPSVYPLDRCYALSVRCLVSSVYGADLQPVSGNAVKNGYLVHLERMINLCPEVLSSECITTRGPLAQRARRVATGSGSSSLNSASPAAASAAAGSTLAGPPVSRLTPQRKDLHTDAWLEMSALGQPVNAPGDSTAATSAQESPTAAAAAGAAKLTDPAAAATDAGVAAVAATAAVVSDASLNAGDGSTQEQSDNVVRLLPQVLGRGAFVALPQHTGSPSADAINPVHIQQQQVANTNAAAAVAPAVWYDPEELELFTREVQVLGRLSHPNIVRLIAVCTAPPRLSLVMEAAETSLDKVVYGGGGAPGGGELLLPLPKVLHIAVQIAQGLAYLHPTVCHGDLKPANVLLNGASSDTPEVKLTDFGQAHIRMSTTFGSSRATLGALDAPAGGTAAFCAPECFDQAGGRAVAVTHKADIYSFAAVLWCMLTGQEPWQGLGAVSIAVQVALRGRSLLSVPSGLAEERCPPKLKRLLAECFEPDPRRRPAAAEVVKQLMLVEEQWRSWGTAAATSIRTAAARAPVHRSIGCDSG
eukprot:XP_001697412.1 predicted protein [Chlamydomonas reinhardtii]